MRIEYDIGNERDLQKKIAEKLNKHGYNFKRTKSSDFCDIRDEIRKIYIEVKSETFAPAQLLYGLARSNISDAEYVGLGRATEVVFFRSPKFDDIIDFAKSIDPDLSSSPSSVVQKIYNDKAFDILGEPVLIYTYNGDFNLGDNNIFITETNIDFFRELFEKYNIDAGSFISFITGVHDLNHELAVNNEGRIINLNTGEFFRNREIQDDLSGFNYRAIKNKYDALLLRLTRININETESVLHGLDRLSPIEVRRSLGLFFTRNEIPRAIPKMLRRLEAEPEYIIEPYVGGGSLMDPLIDIGKHGAASDIKVGGIETLKKKYAGCGWVFKSMDVIKTPLEQLRRLWAVSDDLNLLILTNPPFGTSSTNILSSKKKSMKGKKSRKIKIDYGTVGDTYGKGDLVIPAVGKLIDFIKMRGQGYLAFFCPMGVFCGKRRYSKLFKALLKDFDFLEGHIFSGAKFNSVTSKKPIAFTVWKYNSDCNTDIEKLVFSSGDKDLVLKPTLLLKDGWKYDSREEINGEIAVQHNETFNSVPPKMFHTQVKKGGSELDPRNVKVDLKMPNIPSELIYGLWSVSVGYRSYISHPLYIDNAYVHLPDFDKIETFEILAYSSLYTIIIELGSKNCGGKIGFDINRHLLFGGSRLTDGVKFLFEVLGGAPVGGKTINEVVEELRGEPDITKLPIKEWRAEIRSEIGKRLEAIGYWDFIPVPEDFIGKEDAKQQVLSNE